MRPLRSPTHSATRSPRQAVILPSLVALLALPLAGTLGPTYRSPAFVIATDSQNLTAGVTSRRRIYPFIYVAASGRGTIVRIDVNSGAILGEYLTAPDGLGRNPSRTTVDLSGNVWVANRDASGVSGGEEKGSVTRVGLIIGGTRADSAGRADPAGQYFRPPYQYSTCVDRDGDYLIKTSRELGNILPWTNVDGADTHGGVSTAADECITIFTRVAGVGTRTVAVDGYNDLWVGGHDNKEHEKISGVTGRPVPGTRFNLGCGGYGGLIDSRGVLWSADRANGLLRFDTRTMTGACLDTSHGDYGLGVNPRTGEIWHSFYSGGKAVRLASDGSLLTSHDHGGSNAQGVVVDGAGYVWVAHSLVNGTRTVGRLRSDGTHIGNVELPGGDGPTGVAVDVNGKIWVTNINSNNVMRIDPFAGPVGEAGVPVGAVDLTVDLGSGASPYNYSDMTGFVAAEQPRPGGWMEALMDTTTLVVTYALLAFLVERLTNGIGIVLGYSQWWRRNMEASLKTSAEARAKADRNRRVALFAFSATLAVVGAILLKLNLLAQVGLGTAATLPGAIATGLLIAAGADPIRELSKMSVKRQEAASQPQPVQLGGTIILRTGESAGSGDSERGPTRGVSV